MVLQYSRDWLVLTVIVIILSNVCLGVRGVRTSYPKSKSTSLREVIQVYPPPLSPEALKGSTSCSFTLMEHVFGESAGKPFVGTYDPLCGRNWDTAVFNLSVVSYGIQFDRLGSIWLANTEIWRTCTAEPVSSGIHFEYLKDVSNFKSLLQSSQSLVVDIGNYIVGPYNGSFYATLSVTFYNITTAPSVPPPDEIIPLSKCTQENGVSVSTYFNLPNDTATISVLIPDSSSIVVLELFASGNADEEFWYTNTPNEYLNTFAAWNVSLLGDGPFREVLVHIDDQVVGSIQPFEIVFTGGINPGFWERIVGHRTFDLPAYQVDLTPFLDILRGSRHTIKFSMRGEPNILQNWYVSGHLKIWYSKSSTPCTSNKPPSFNKESTSITTIGKVSTDNTSFSVTTLASRHGPYSFDFENQQFYRLSNNGSTLFSPVSQTTYFDSPLSRGYFIFTLDIVETDFPDGSISLNASLSQIFHRYSTNVIDGSISLEHAEVSTVGTFAFWAKTNTTFTDGKTSVMLSYTTPSRKYVRNVRAIGTQIVSDYEIDQ